MNEKHESNNENYETDSLITNINNVQVDNHKSSLSSKSSQSCKSSFSFFNKGKTDPEEIELQKQYCRNCLCHNNYCYLIKMIWIFYINFHSIIKLIFKCDECKKIINILMDKSQSGKEMNIEYDPNFYDQRCIKWDYFPKSKISYNFCEQCFDKASGDWALINNNCWHFAKYIWKEIIKKDKKKQLLLIKH